MSGSFTLALGGDTMLGRGVADELRTKSPRELFSEDVVAAARSADLFVLNLECCISERGSPWPDPGKPFFFRAPPSATETLQHLGVGCVTLANNHALDFGEDALLDTFEHLERAGIKWIGAGPDLQRARATVHVDVAGSSLALVACSDHPEDFAARHDRPGIAYAELHRGVPEWLLEAIARAGCDHVMVAVHWGPNMVTDPRPHVRDAAASFVAAGACLVAGHSAHVFHGVQGRVLYDLGDLIDDYAVDPVLRNDLGLLWLVTFDEDGPAQLEALPLRLDYCYTRVAEGEDADWIANRFKAACRDLGTEVSQRAGRLIVALR